MNKIKSLKDISWLVSEEEYRADKALSYSTLAKYERSGFNGLDKLFDKVESPSLTNGSAVDSIITGGQEEFDERFLVAEFPQTPDTIIQIVKTLFKAFSNEYNNLTKIPDKDIIAVAATFNYQNNWKPETRAKVIKEKGAEYYSLLYVAQDKTILSTTAYTNVINQVDALKNSEATSYYFAPNNPFEPEIERLYQLKFKATLNGINYRCMADLIIVDYANKTVTPVDLKTSSHTEYDFYKSFVDWNYAIQARLYWRIIRANLNKDEYFKDFTLQDYKFIVVNKTTLYPLVWDFEDTQTKGTLYFGENSDIKMRDPEEIGKELTYYLNNKPKVPVDIKNTNSLRYWLNKL